MAKQVATVTEAARQAGKIAANLAGRVLALQIEARRIDAEEAERRNRSFQLVSTRESASALIKIGKTTIQVEGDDFAITHG
jgi:hypothetical protein